MTFFPETRIKAADSTLTDAFGRLRVVNPTTIYDSQSQYTKQLFTWEDVLTGGGTTTHLPNESSVRLDVATASGDKVVRQTHQYFRYQPGKSQVIALTTVVGAIKANTRQRWGYFDANNGVFFEQNGTTLRVVRRTNVTGSPVDNAVAQSSWNVDHLDGLGPSGLTLDTTKANIFVIDCQWLGVGRVRLGVDIDGKIVVCHEFRNANALATVYMTTANLPVRYELENTGVAASSTALTTICTSVLSEGGFEEDRGFSFGISTGITIANVTTRRPIISIRPRLTFNSIATRGIDYLDILSYVYAQNNDSFIEVVYGGLPSRITLGGGTSWANVNTNLSSLEYDVSSTTISGGVVVANGWAVTGAGSNTAVLAKALSSRLALALDVAGTTQDILSIVCTSVTGTSHIGAAFSWVELY